MDHPIPELALDGRLAIVGISGSGKSTTAKGGVERVLKQERRVCVVDLLDGWWGLRVKRDGKTPAFPAAIFGGLHGDLPLTESAGALIGQAVAQSDGSSIVSLAELGDDAARRRFALAFFNSLHKHNRAPLHLIIDEADFYAPQQPVKDGPGPLLLNRVKEIAARGRMRGFRCWTITQRPAKLHKDVLSQADTLIAMQLTSTQDRKALDGWIGDQGDEKSGKAVVASLPGLQLGQGVLWSPRLGILETVEFPLPETYDSSRTPEYGEKLPNVELKPLDLGALKERLATVEAETKANDPKALKAEVAKLRRELAVKPSTAAPTADPKAVDDAYQNGLAEGLARGESRAKAAMQLVKARIGDASDALTVAFETLDSPMPAPRTSLQKMQIAQPRVARPAAPLVKANGQFNRSQHRVLRALAMWKALGHENPSREMVAAASGYSPSSGGFNNLLGGLATAGAIGKPMPGHLNLLMAVDEMSPEEGREMLLGYLTNPQRKLVDALNGAGGMSRDDLGAATEYSPSSGGFNNLIGSLSTLGLIVKPQTGHVALSDWAQELLQ
jgi:hypothetical protein